MLFSLPVAFLALTLSAGAPGAPRDAVPLEREARQIETMLIAPCCWMQPVSEHQSQASEDVKQQIRVLLAEGKTRQQVLDAFVAQYGQRILVEPSARGFGLVLYGGLALAFLATAVGLVAWIRVASGRRASAPVAAAATNADEAVYAARLDDELRDMD